MKLCIKMTVFLDRFLNRLLNFLTIFILKISQLKIIACRSKSDSAIFSAETQIFKRLNKYN